MSVRIAMDAAGGGAIVSFEGIERDLDFSIDQHMKLLAPVGGTPVMRFLWGIAQDEVSFSFSVWTGWINAAALETTLPPFSVGGIANLYLSGNASQPFWPGFGNWNASTSEWVIQNVTLEPLDSMGRKGVLFDLYGYKAKGRFSANGYGIALNERGNTVPTSTVIPDILHRKFASHQIQDASAAFSPFPLSGSTFPLGIQHGRRYDSNIQFDNMMALEADSLINWFRANRGQVFSFDASSNMAFGPAYPNPSLTMAIPTALNINRSNASWEGKLSISRYET